MGKKEKRGGRVRERGYNAQRLKEESTTADSFLKMTVSNLILT